MAVTVIDERRRLSPDARQLRVIKWSWSTGAAETTAAGGNALNVTGEILGIKAEPDGTAKPADDYDVTIVDAVNGMDVLNSDAVNLPQAITSVENIRVPVDFQNSRPIYLVNENLSFSGSGLGNSAVGAFYLYVLEP